jgi:hypothetical protein
MGKESMTPGRKLDFEKRKILQSRKEIKKE